MTSTPAPFTWSEETFLSDGVACAARVYRPRSVPEAGAPAVVMGHGFGAVRALRLYAYAEQFAAAGYLAVVFDYRGFGESDGTPRQLLDIGMQHQDWRAALAFARGLPEADSRRIVAWGTSFGGGHVISLAGQGESLAAIIAQVPHVSGPAAVRATGVRASLRVLPLGLRDQLRALRGRAPVYLECAAAPGQAGAMTTPDALPGMDRLMAESGITRDSYPTHVAARIALKIGLYSPKRRAAAVTCPALVQIADSDTVTPRRVAEATAARMAHATVKVYSCGHFDPYVEPLFGQVVADQIAFLREHV
ncbi:alpha/beta hydrolase [Nocardioides nitrophenolicus]|uniref:alpha/beta hydrolase n=1 Tax=Nocardioides nitrophenolicus TaxID=60489 RepID=UPI00195B2FD7|nr:alpha/beta fold hydrolase [Nocardioides nitrophenolicus]MBM7520366.1 pimeloyl-ACP methyl ester carboxylesterase [Nocardioides nitrophenolicus]